MAVELASSAALDAAVLIDAIRYADRPGFLSVDMWEELAPVRDEPVVRAIPPEPTTPSTFAPLVARLVGPGRMRELRVGDLDAVLSRARPIAALAPRHTDAVAQAASEVLEHASGFAALLESIRAAGFETWWHDVARPALATSIQTAKRAIADLDTEHVLFLVGKLRATGVPNSVWIYLAYCLGRDGFLLSESEIAQRVGDAGDPRYLLRRLAHELLHGFAGQTLVAFYNRAAREDPYLRDLANDNEWLSNIGPEEMFVTAADLYISYRAGLYSLEEAFTFLDGLYGNNLPFSVICLDLLLRVDGLPADYDSWLVDRFRDGTFRVGSIADQVDEILPGYSESSRRSRASHREYIAKLQHLGLASDEQARL